MENASHRFYLHSLLVLVVLSAFFWGRASPASAGGTVCFVKASAPGLNTGTSWANAYQSLQSALGNPACTEIWVAQGGYRPTTGSDRTISFVLKSGVSVYGGFAGTETLRSQRDPVANPTYLNGNIGNLLTSSDNSYHVVTAANVDAEARLDGFTITGGNANSSGGEAAGKRGGGMMLYRSNLNLVNLTFRSNRALLGAGIYNQEGSPTLKNVTFHANPASWGGGMYNSSSSPSLLNVTFSNNSAIDPDNGVGQGGGMYNAGSSPSLVNVTFYGNSANWGAGMFNWVSSPSLAHITFSGNSATAAGGAIANLQNNNPTIENSILYGDTPGEIDNQQNSVTTVSYSIVQGGYPGTGNQDANPLLGPLQDNGGFTMTMALGFLSPAIDRAIKNGCPPRDQRGLLRPQGPACDLGAYEYPQKKLSASSIASQDGWILESSETSAAGGTLNAAGGNFILGDNASDKQYRSLLSFDTSSLPDNAVITSVTLKIKKSLLEGTDPFTTHGNILVDVKTGPFSDDPALQIQDFEATASKTWALIIKNTPLSGWYSGNMFSISFVYINKTGITQLRLRFAKDDNDDLQADYMKFYSADSETSADRPKLVIKYYVP